MRWTFWFSTVRTDSSSPSSYEKKTRRSLMNIWDCLWKSKWFCKFKCLFQSVVLSPFQAKPDAVGSQMPTVLSSILVFHVILRHIQEWLTAFFWQSQGSEWFPLRMVWRIAGISFQFQNDRQKYSSVLMQGMLPVVNKSLLVNDQIWESSHQFWRFQTFTYSTIDLIFSKAPEREFWTFFDTHADFQVVPYFEDLWSMQKYQLPWLKPEAICYGKD